MIGVGQVRHVVRSVVGIRVVDKRGVCVHEMGHTVGEHVPVQRPRSLHPWVQVVQGGPLAHLVA